MTDFDQKKALQEQIAALSEIQTSLLRRERQLELRYGEIEIEYNTVKKLRGFADVELEDRRTKLRWLTDE